MGNIGWVVAFFVLATTISMSVTWVGLRRGDAVPNAFRALFAAVEERRTFMGLPVIVGVARSNRWVLIIVAFASAPTIAAVVLSAAGAGPDLVAALRPWSGDVAGQALLTYLVIAAVFVLGCVWFLAVARSEVASGAIETPALLRGRRSTDIATRLGAGAFVDEGGTLEELGWRGFLLPLVLLELDRGPATLVVAFLWWAWHLPREIRAFGDVSARRTWIRNQTLFLGTCVALSVLCTEAFLRTGGSFWPALLIHGGTNVWSKALGAGTFSRYSTDLRTVIVGVLAVVVAVAWIV